MSKLPKIKETSVVQRAILKMLGMGLSFLPKLGQGWFISKFYHVFVDSMRISKNLILSDRDFKIVFCR